MEIVGINVYLLFISDINTDNSKLLILIILV